MHPHLKRRVCVEGAVLSICRATEMQKRHTLIPTCTDTNEIILEDSPVLSTRSVKHSLHGRELKALKPIHVFSRNRGDSARPHLRGGTQESLAPPCDIPSTLNKRLSSPSLPQDPQMANTIASAVLRKPPTTLPGKDDMRLRQRHRRDAERLASPLLPRRSGSCDNTFSSRVYKCQASLTSGAASSCGLVCP